MALIDINKCIEFNCKYFNKVMYFEDELFNESYGRCTHKEAPENNYLGGVWDDNYADIPDWCPVRKDKGETRLNG